MIKGKILKDTTMSMFAVVIMHFVIQFILYPFLERKMGSIGYGEYIYCITFVNIIAAAIGSGINLERMKLSVNEETKNGDFLLMYFVFCVLIIPAYFLYLKIGNLSFDFIESIVFVILCFLTIFRNYGDVDFRLRIDYKNYFLYYVFLSVGYLFGLLVWGESGKCYHILICGELFALIFLFFKGKILRDRPFALSNHLLVTIRLTIPLVISILVSNCILNMDRILLKIVCGSEAVSLYYVASLFGKTMSLVSMPLNNVLIGYLTRYDKKITTREIHWIMKACIAIGVIVEIACSIGSYIILPFLYPEMDLLANKYYIVANMSSVIFFITSFMTIFLLRYGKEKYQLYMNVIFATAFFVLCVPSCIEWGIWGLCVSLIVTNIIRLGFVYVMCIRSVKENKVNVGVSENRLIL